VFPSSANAFGGYLDIPVGDNLIVNLPASVGIRCLDDPNIPGGRRLALEAGEGIIVYNGSTQTVVWNAGNISSTVTRHAAGDYTFNFRNNYESASHFFPDAIAYDSQFCGIQDSGAGYVRIRVRNDAGTLVDATVRVWVKGRL
jgi:hypothetical protein